MEWYEILRDLISTLGFPIACCCYLLWQNSKLTETLTELKDAIVDLRDRLK